MLMMILATVIVATVGIVIAVEVSVEEEKYRKKR